MAVFLSPEQDIFSESFTPAVTPQLFLSSAALPNGDWAVAWHPAGRNADTDGGPTGVVESTSGIVSGSTKVPLIGGSLGAAAAGLANGDLVIVESSAASPNVADFTLILPSAYATKQPGPFPLHSDVDLAPAVAEFDTQAQTPGGPVPDLFGLAISYYEVSLDGQTISVELTLVDGNQLALGNTSELTFQVAQLPSQSSLSVPTQVVELHTSGGPSEFAVEYGVQGQPVELKLITVADAGATPVFAPLQFKLPTITGSASLVPTADGNLAIADSVQGQIEFSLFQLAQGNTVVHSISPSAETADIDPQAAQLASGDFVVVWFNQSHNLIEGQILDVSGQDLGAPFLVNNLPLGSSAFTSPSLSIAALPDGLFVVNWDAVVGPAQTETQGVEQQLFAEGFPLNFPFTDPENIGITEAIYIGYFGRAAEPAGEQFWTNAVNSGKISTSDMAASFSVQSETTTLYPFLAQPFNATPPQVVSFIESVYADLFNRQADPAGLAFWQNYLTAHLGDPHAVGTFILAVIGGAQGNDQITLTDKVSVADFFTQKIDLGGHAFDASADALAHSAIASVTSNTASVIGSELAINQFV